MQIRNSKLYEASKCRVHVYSAVNHPWWMSTLFLLGGFSGGLAGLFVTFCVRCVMMTTARPELPYPCGSQAKN